MMDECEKCTITKPRKTGVTETVEEEEREREREQELVASMTSQAQDYLRSFYAHQILEKIEFLEIYVPKS
jgi:hypothetical protein